MTAAIPAAAGMASAEMYHEVSDPTLKTTVDGSNVLSPGATTTVGVLVRNTGEVEVDGPTDRFERTVQSLSLRPGAALSTTVTVKSGSAPLTVRTGEQAVAPIAVDSMQRVPIELEVDEEATPGTYRLPVEMTYRYLDRLHIDEDDTTTYYETKTVERSLIVRVESAAQFEVVSVTGDGLTEGGDGEVQATVRNTGTETASNAALRLHATDWLTPRSSNAGIGTLDPNETATATFRVGVNDVSAGDHAVRFSLRYDDANGVISETPVHTGTVTTGEGPRFGVKTSAEALYVDSTGVVTLTVRNTGDTTAQNVRAQLRESSPLVPVSGSASLGDLAPGETATAPLRIEVSDVAAGEYPLSAVVKRDDSFGDPVTTEVRTGTVTANEGPEFAVNASAEALYVDSTGAVTLTVRNTGDTTAQNARVQLRESSPLVPVSGSASLGDLAPGETATTRLRVEMSDRALAGEYPLSIVVKRDDAFNDPVVTEPLSVGVDVGPERTFETSSAGSASAGSTTTVSFEVTNSGEAPMRNAVVRLNADSPFETDDDTAYVGRVEPGESATVQFTVSVDGAATPKAYALDTTVAFDNAFNRRVVTDVESTELRVEAGSGGLLAAIINTLSDLIGL